MNGPIEMIITFSDNESLYNHQVDLIKVLQAALNSDVRNNTGFYTLFLLEEFAKKSHELLETANEKLNHKSAA